MRYACCYYICQDLVWCDCCHTLYISLNEGANICIYLEELDIVSLWIMLSEISITVVSIDKSFIKIWSRLLILFLLTCHVKWVLQRSNWFLTVSVTIRTCFYYWTCHYQDHHTVMFSLFQDYLTSHYSPLENDSNHDTLCKHMMWLHVYML